MSTIDGELRAVRALARQMRTRTGIDSRTLAAWAAQLDSAAQGIGRSVVFLRAEAAGKLPDVPPDEKYDGLTPTEALCLLAVKAQRYAGDDAHLAAEITACRDALSEALSPAKPAPGSLASPDGESPGAARRDASATSRRAALQVTPRTGTMRRKVLDALAAVSADPRQPGLTDVELARITGLRDNSVRPRRIELVRGGWVENTGKTKTHHGAEHAVWALTDRAAAELTGG